jgi:hypothetical protein
MKQKLTKKIPVKRDKIIRFSVSMKPETEEKLIEHCGSENRNKSQMIQVMIMSYEKK